jgi:hypothetical protein
MNGDDSELESSLKALRPRRLSDGVKDRIERQLSRAEPGDGTPGWVEHRDWRGRRFGVMAVSVAAALLLALCALWILSRRDVSVPPAIAKSPPASAAPAEPAPAYRLVSSESVVLDQRDEGTYVLREGGPARKYRVQYVDHAVWRDPQRGRSVTVTRPREEVRFVSLDTY